VKVWLPYVRSDSGVDVFTERLASALRRLGAEAEPQAFGRANQYAPWLLRGAAPPAGTSIILCNSWNAFAFARSGIPLVVVNHLCVHDAELEPYLSTAQRAFHRLLLRHFEAWSYARADAVAAVSDYTADQVGRAFPGVAPQRLPNGVDTEFFCPGASDPGRHRDGLDILFVGNLSRRKGVDLLPEIMRRVAPEHRLFYTAGLRPGRGLSNGPNMHCLGALDRLGVRDAYRRADVVLFPTRLEGLPYAALEGMSCARAVITSRAASLPELIDHGRTGWLCPVDDVDAFAAAIEQLHADPRLRCSIGAAAREVIVERFTEQTMAQGYADLFGQLLARG
jgi:starch synthase